MGRFHDHRKRMRERLQKPPFDFPPGLAHFVSSVAEPRSDAKDLNEQVETILAEHREQLIAEIEGMQPGNPTGKMSMRSSGGRVEHAVERAAQRLRIAAEEHGAYEIVQRLNDLQLERRFGVSDAEDSSEDSQFLIDIDALPRSTTSGRRVGVWR